MGGLSLQALLLYYRTVVKAAHAPSGIGSFLFASRKDPGLRTKPRPNEHPISQRSRKRNNPSLFLSTAFFFLSLFSFPPYPRFRTNESPDHLTRIRKSGSEHFVAPIQICRSCGAMIGQRKTRSRGHLKFWKKK